MMEDEEILRKLKELDIPEHVNIQSGYGTDTPLTVYVDADYKIGDGNCGLHTSAKNTNEPAIVYVRSDMMLKYVNELEESKKEIKRLKDKIADLGWTIDYERECTEQNRGNDDW